MQAQQFLPVNWIDGMKINKSHFIFQDYAFSFQLMQTASGVLNDFNYGLMPSANLAPKLFVTVDNQHHVRLRIQQCRVITRGGLYFQISEDTDLSRQTSLTPVPDMSFPFDQLKGKSHSFFVILSVNPYDRIACGSLDPEEMPARLPFTMPKFFLSLVPVEAGYENISGQFHIPVARLRVDEHRVILDDSYIPPCTSVGSHPDLLSIHAGLEQFYTRMENYTLQIIQKIHQKKQVNEMSAIVQSLSENMLTIIASQLSEVRTLCISQPPVFMICKVASMARHFKNTLDCYVGTGKEELINYCTEWCNVNQVELDGSITGLTNHSYNHFDVNASVEKVLQFTRTISNLFGNLARLDYIGKKKDAGIFVNEKPLVTEPETPVVKRKSFLAD